MAVVPREQPRQGAVCELRNVWREREQISRERVKHRGCKHRQLHQCEHGTQAVGEAPKRQVRLPIFDEGGRGSQQHDDRRLDDDGEGERHAERRKVDGRIGQAGDERRQIRSLDCHHQPSTSERQPKAKDRQVGQRSGGHASQDDTRLRQDEN